MGQIGMLCDCRRVNFFLTNIIYPLPTYQFETLISKFLHNKQGWAMLNIFFGAIIIWHGIFNAVTVGSNFLNATKSFLIDF